MEIIKLHGTDSALYPLVGPLVMNPEVLKQNLNFPFKTTEHFEWYIAVSGHSAIGFVPVEHRGKDYIINNYYIPDKESIVLSQLLSQLLSQILLEHFNELPHRVEHEIHEEGGKSSLKILDTEGVHPALSGYRLVAVCLKKDVEIFRELGFSTKKVWSRYIKLTIE